MSKIVVFALLSLIISTIGTVGVAKAVSDNAVVYVEIVNKSTRVVTTRGSGVVIGSDGFILTAKHVLESLDPVTQDLKVSVKSKDNTVPARLFDCAARDVDICLIYTSSLPSGATGPSIACRFPTISETIMAQGFPPGPNALTSTNGTVAASAFGVQFKTYMTAPLIDGMSGGPISDSKGEVLGIIFGGAAEGGLTFFTPIAFGRTLLITAGVKCAE